MPAADPALIPIALSPWLALPLLFVAGAVAGVLNVVAGGGSFLTLPVLIFLGLPSGVANGTNRVGILMQNLGAVWSFDRDGVLDRRALVWAGLPTTVGSVLGARLALEVSDDGFRRVLALVMVAMSLVSLWRPKPPSGLDAARPRLGLLAAGFFVVGVYAGFIQAGVGFLILAVTTLAGLDLVRGNAVKVAAILCSTPLSLAILALGGKVVWGLGLALGLGNLVGGLAGARLTVLKGHAWLRSVVTVTVIVCAVLLWLR